MRVQFSPALVTFFLCAVVAAGAQTGNRAVQPAAGGSKTGLPGTLDSASGVIAAPTAPFANLGAVIEGLEATQRLNHAYMVPFTVTREYELFSGDDREPKGTVMVKVHFQPPSTETWEIDKTSGSERAEKVVKHLLDNEVKNAKDGKLAVTREHYDFFYAGIGEANHRPCYILQLVPKRDDSSLIRGRIWVDRDTYLIHRFEGELAKSPTWWIKSLKLFRSYGDWGGVWLPTSSKGVADVRLFGPHTMTERVLSYRAARVVLEGPTAELARLRFRQPGLSLSYRPTPAAAAAGISVVTGR